ncbi:MAG TPA: TerD family protein [Actinomycetales bacterium]|nr:TerD family protein [Actinomycetales bacterium]
MGASLRKGGNILLTAADPPVRRVLVGLSWNPHTASGAGVDLDETVLLCGEDRKVLSDAHVVGYDDLEPPAPGGGDRAVGDDDEQVEIDLETVPDDVQNIVFAMAIRGAEARRQTFGTVRDVVMRLVDLRSGAEVARYEIEAETATETAIVCGELYRHPSGWKFRAVGQGWSDGLAGIARDYGARL